MALDKDVIDVTVRIQSPFVTSNGLGTPLIAGAATFSGEYVKSYSADSDYADDTDLSAPIIAMLTAIFSQEDYPSAVKVGKVDADAKLDINLAPENPPIDGKIYGLKINGTNYEYTADVVGGDTTADVVDAIIAAITAGAEPVTMTDNGNDFDIEANVAGTPFTYADGDNVDGTQVTTVTQANVSIKTSLDAIKAEDNDWYFLLTESQVKLQIQRASEWSALAANQPRIYFPQTADAEVIDPDDTDDIASWAKDANYDHVAVTYHAQATQYVAAAWVGFVGAVDLDEKTTLWAYKTLTGTYTKYEPDADAKSALEAKNCNYYGNLYGIGATYPGRIAAGNQVIFIDIKTSADWWAVRLAEKIAEYLLAISNRKEKVPMSNAGIAQVESWVREVSDDGVDIGHFLEDTLEINMPTLEEGQTNTLSDTNRQNRHIPLTASVQAESAIQTIQVTADLYV